MNLGKLRHRVTIESSSASRDEFGGEVITWATVATVWAAVEPLSGREFLDARRQEAEVSTRIRIRYRAGLVPGMRVTWGPGTSPAQGSHVYDILAVIERESRRREIWLMVREWGIDR